MSKIISIQMAQQVFGEPVSKYRAEVFPGNITIDGVKIISLVNEDVLPPRRVAIALLDSGNFSRVYSAEDLTNYLALNEISPDKGSELAGLFNFAYFNGSNKNESDKPLIEEFPEMGLHITDKSQKQFLMYVNDRVEGVIWKLEWLFDPTGTIYFNVSEERRYRPAIKIQ